jgi:hypothetical protein
MIWRLVWPIGFPIFFLAIAWFAERNASTDHKVGRKKMRLWFVVSLALACSEYAEAWHNEIGFAWHQHAGLTEFLTFMVFIVIFFALRPLLRK